MIDLDELIAEVTAAHHQAGRIPQGTMDHETQWWPLANLYNVSERVIDTLPLVRAERDAALARIAELEAELAASDAAFRSLKVSTGPADARLTRAEARIAEAAKLHRKAHAVFSWATGGVRYEDPCPDCDGKAGVHDCGCWADVDIEYHCAECDGSGERASWPCPTAVALGLDEGENEK